jgi:hypothetical protein
MFIRLRKGWARVVETVLRLFQMASIVGVNSVNSVDWVADEERYAMLANPKNMQKIA